MLPYCMHMLDYTNLYDFQAQGRSTSAQDETCKTTRSTSAKEIPPKNPYDEVQT